MRHSVLLSLAFFGCITFGYSEYKPEVIELSIRIADAAHRMDRESLDQLTAGVIQSRGVTDADSYGKLLSSVAYAWKHFASKDSTTSSNAYHMRRIAREAQLDVGFNNNTTVRDFGADRWLPELYSPAVDERSFAVARQEETDLWLRYWRKLEDAHTAVMAAGRPPQTASSQATEGEERQRYLAEGIALNYWSVVRRDRPTFARSTIPQLGAAYTHEPVDFDELRGLVEHHMNGSGATNAWNDIVAALRPQFQQRAAAAYAKPPVFTRRSLLPPIVPPPRPEPGLPAIAKPSRIREGIAARSSQGAVDSAASGTAAGAERAGSGAEHPGSRAVWPWAVLGLAALAGGWVWLRGRS